MKTYRDKLLFDGSAELLYIRARDTGYLLKMIRQQVELSYLAVSLKRVPLKRYVHGFGIYNITNIK